VGQPDQPMMSVRVDADHGGRWPSLLGRNGREWLWRREAPKRDSVRPGDAFVDAGGMEECLPTIAGVPDHGDVWSRPWARDGDGLSVEVDGRRLHRVTTVGPAGVRSSYELTAQPGWWFIWAAHTLIDVSPGARVLAPAGRPIWVNSDEGTADRHWPSHGETDLSVLGEDDGTALMIIIPELPEITVVDGSDSITFRLQVTGQPFAIAIWRNLCGWPAGAPYRSIGIEPMLGYSPTLALARTGESAVVPADGRVEWSLTIDA
jgi:hypothetical protein